MSSAIVHTAVSTTTTTTVCVCIYLNISIYGIRILYKKHTTYLKKWTRYMQTLYRDTYRRTYMHTLYIQCTHLSGCTLYILYIQCTCRRCMCVCMYRHTIHSNAIYSILYTVYYIPPPLPASAYINISVYSK